MTGDELSRFLERRLALEGIADEQQDPDALLAHLTTARNRVRRLLAVAAPRAVMETVALVQDPSVATTWALPAAAADPLRIYTVRDACSGLDLVPGRNVKQAGQYEWLSLRSLRVPAFASYPEGIEVQAALAAGAQITATTPEAGIGVPVAAHEAVGYLASVLVLTADEESDAGNAQTLFEAEMAELEILFAEHDVNDGAALREAFGAAYDGWLYS